MSRGKKITGFSHPRWIVFQLLEKCNLRCSMCYEWGRSGSYFKKKELAQLDIDVVKQVITDCSVAQPYFELFGGEPLLYPYLYEVLSLIQSFHSSVDIPTNGTLLEKHAEMLVECEPRRIWVSIDGPEKINDLQRGKGVYKKAIAGIGKLDEEKRKKGKKNPMTGVTFVVTPLNYRYIEDFFLKELDLSMIEWVSIEFQLYLTDERFQKYASVMKDRFGVETTQCAQGLVTDKNDFSTIDIKELIRQVKGVRHHCGEKGINVIGYPKTMDEDNLANFYSAQWDKMIDRKARCSFPWLYLEINAAGDVTPCHTFYDYTIGNVYEKRILDIWNGRELEKFRSYTRKNMFDLCIACSRYYSDL